MLQTKTLSLCASHLMSLAFWTDAMIGFLVVEDVFDELLHLESTITVSSTASLTDIASSTSAS